MIGGAPLVAAPGPAAKHRDALLLVPLLACAPRTCDDRIGSYRVHASRGIQGSAGKSGLQRISQCVLSMSAVPLRTASVGHQKNGSGYAYYDNPDL